MVTYTVGGGCDRAVSDRERRMVEARGRTSILSELSVARNWQTPAREGARVVEEKLMEMLTERA